MTSKNEAGELPNKAVATSESKNEAGELPNRTVATRESKNKAGELPKRTVATEAANAEEAQRDAVAQKRSGGGEKT